MAAIFGEGNFFLKIAKSTLLSYPVGRKFFNEITLSCTVMEIEGNLCFSIFGKVAITQSVI